MKNLLGPRLKTALVFTFLFSSAAKQSGSSFLGAQEAVFHTFSRLSFLKLQTKQYAMEKGKASKYGMQTMGYKGLRISVVLLMSPFFFKKYFIVLTEL